MLDLRWRRSDCLAYLAEHGLGDTVRSACLGCTDHNDAEWLRLKDHHPAGWADVVAFDAAIRRGSARANSSGNPLRGEFYLHRQRVPLAQVWLRRQAADEPEAPGWGPWTCPHQDEDAEPAA